LSVKSELAGANCANGGQQITSGVDKNGNGVLDADADEVTATTYICNGATGAAGAAGSDGATGAAGADGAAGATGATGASSLVRITAEPAGANCVNGGKKIEIGVDTNGDGVLEDSEVNAPQTAYTCNP